MAIELYHIWKKTFLENRKVAVFVSGFFLKKVFVKGTYTKKSRNSIGQLVWNTAVREIEALSVSDVCSPIEIFM